MGEKDEPPTWTKERIEALSPQDRHTLWKNARTKTSSEAQALVSLIEASGLPYSEPGSLKSNDPVARKIYDIVFSPEGKRACIEATNAGLPAVAGVDEMLNQALGVDYGAANMATNWAGVIVGDLMRSLGYEHGGDRAMPKGSVAKTAAFWTKRS